jgi:hypothetical protein
MFKGLKAPLELSEVAPHSGNTELVSGDHQGHKVWSGGNWSEPPGNDSLESVNEALPETSEQGWAPGPSLHTSVSSSIKRE